ncbi:MAG: hypothetical protein WBL27_09575 [Salinimicrobium sp.]
MTVALLAINITVLAFFDERASRVVRFLSMVVFYAIFLLDMYYKRNALLILGALVVNDLLLVFYESTMSQDLIMFIRLCAFLLLARLVFPYLRKIKVKPFEGILFTVILIMNLLLLYSIQDSINAVNKEGLLGEILVYGYGTAVIISVSAAFTFYSRYFDKASIFFLLAILGLVLSDFTYFIGFYLEFPVFYYLDRAFNILAVGFLLHFIFLFKRKIARGFYDGAGESL